MPSYPLTFPTIGVTNSRFAIRRVVSESTSQFSGAQQLYLHPGAWWEGEVTFRPVSYSERQQLLAFLANLNGKYGTFNYGDPDYLARGPKTAPVTVAASTNFVRNGAVTGATNGIIGSGGALPTNWSFGGTLGLTYEIIGSGTDVDRTYVDIKISGTATSTSSAIIALEAATIVAALSGQTWTSSLYAKMMAGSVSGLNSVNVRIGELDSGGVFLTSQDATDIKASLNSSTWTRSSITRTLNNASTAYTRIYLRLSANSGATIDITLRISSPQLEQQATATPFILTTGASASRPAGVTVTTAGQTGTSLQVRGYGESASNVAAAGDYIQLGTGASAKLHIITEAANADYRGRATLTIEPPLRSSPSADAAVTFTGAKGVFRLSENVTEWASDAACVNMVTIAFREAL